MKEPSVCPFCLRNDALSIGEDIDDEGTIYAYHVTCSHCGSQGRNRFPIGWAESHIEAWEAWEDRQRRPNK